MSTPGAERTRRYRERIERGEQLVTIPISTGAVDTLVRLGFLPEVENADGANLRSAIGDLIRWAEKQRR